MSRAVLAPFEAYQKARVTFVQTVAELAQRPQNIEALQSAGKFIFLKFVLQSTIWTNMLTMSVTLHRRYGPPETSASR